MIAAILTNRVICPVQVAKFANLAAEVEKAFNKMSAFKGSGSKAAMKATKFHKELLNAYNGHVYVEVK